MTAPAQPQPQAQPPAQPQPPTSAPPAQPQPQYAPPAPMAQYVPAPQPVYAPPAQYVPAPMPYSGQPLPAPSAVPGQPAPAPGVAQPAPQYQPQPPAGPQPPAYQPALPLPPTLTEPGTPDGQGSDADWSKLPQWAQRQIKDARDENARRRVSERTAHVGQHAWIAATQLGVNPAALLGSTLWASEADKISPSAPDFGAQLTAAIHRVAQAQPWIIAQQAPTGPPAQPAPGTPGAVPAPGAPGQPQYLPAPGAPGQQPPAPGAPGQNPPTLPAPGAPTSGGDFSAGSGAGVPITQAQLDHLYATGQQALIAQYYREGRLSHLL